jgi:hypothetical protein
LPQSSSSALYCQQHYLHVCFQHISKGGSQMPASPVVHGLEHGCSRWPGFQAAEFLVERIGCFVFAAAIPQLVSDKRTLSLSSFATANVQPLLAAGAAEANEPGRDPDYRRVHDRRHH